MEVQMLTFEEGEAERLTPMFAEDHHEGEAEGHQVNEGAVGLPEGVSPLLAAYVASASHQDDPLDGCLVEVNADLVWMAQLIGAGLRQACPRGPVSLEFLQKLRPHIDTQLRVTRQIDRFSGQERRKRQVVKSRRPSEAGGPDRAATASAHPEQPR
jgi:hypothetical protein